MCKPINIRGIEGSNDYNETLSEVLGYLTLLAILFVVMVVGGTHDVS